MIIYEHSTAALDIPCGSEVNASVEEGNQLRKLLAITADRSMRLVLAEPIMLPLSVSASLYNAGCKPESSYQFPM
jgi:hypothetical protein